MLTFLVSCVLLGIRCVSEDMQCCVKICVFREQSLCAFCLWGIQRDLGADGRGKDVIVSFLGSVGVDTCI